MPFCPCLSEKKPSAPDFINTNDIGVLCFVAGLEGPLCRLMDLIPDAIKAVVKLEPSKLGNYNKKIINKLLAKVIAKSFSLLIDEITNKISLEDFCSLDPPPEPEDITYEDVYKFIADLVPILGRFFDLYVLKYRRRRRRLDFAISFLMIFSVKKGAVLTLMLKTTILPPKKMMVVAFLMTAMMTAIPLMLKFKFLRVVVAIALARLFSYSTVNN